MPQPKRTAGEVIGQAIKENQFGERLLYLFSCASFFAGLAVLGYGIYHAQSLTAILGTVANLMFYPAMRLARSIRDQNMAIRLLEIPLNNSRTVEEAATVLKEFFESTIPQRRRLPPSGKRELPGS
jgi:hypothetical protein